MKRFTFLLSPLCLFTTVSRGATEPKVVDAYGKLPLSFEANQGQSDAQVKFLSRGNGYTLFLTSTDAVLFLQKGAPSGGAKQHGSGRIDVPVLPQNPNRGDDAKTKSALLRIRLVGANPAPQLTGFDDLPGTANYFIGNDPTKWRTDIATYAKVKYRAVYPGVDLVYYGNQRQLEHDFIVAPGADPGLITLRLEGTKKVSLDSHGDLVLKTQNGEVRFQKPLVYQEVDGVRQEVSGGYSLKGKNRVGFEVAAYDVMKPLVIDPTLAYSTYLGSGGDDAAYGIAVDSSGNAYVTGRTTGTNFPGTSSSPIQSALSGSPDAFVTKINAAGTALVYSTYLGGSGYDAGEGIAVDSSGNAYVTGYTQSTDFPGIGSSPIQSAFGGGTYDAFVTEINAAGTALVYSTYLGGSGDDLGVGIAVDSSGNTYVTGYTQSTNFPGTSSSLNQSAYGGGPYDAFVTKINVAGTSLVYSTYLGGSGDDSGVGIAVDSSGNAYVTGATNSTNFPGTSSSLIQSAYGGGPNPTPSGYTNYDAFVTKVNAAGTALVYSTYLGASDTDVGRGIAVDSSGNAYVMGDTKLCPYGSPPCSTNQNFPGTSSSLIQPVRGGARDAFVTKINAAGTALVYSTYLGGCGDEGGGGIAVDSSGNAYVTGITISGGGGISCDFPTTTGAPQTTSGGYYDAFVTEINAAGTALVYSTYLGGSGYDGGAGIAVDSSGNAYVTGITQSANFPGTSSSLIQSAFPGGTSPFVTKIAQATPGVSFSLAPVSLSFDNVAVGARSTRDVTLTNTGTMAVPITSIRVAGQNPGQFSQSNTCGASVPVNSTCTISVVFQPTTGAQPQPRKATLNVNAGGGGGTKSVTLSGTGGPSYALAPSTLAFGNHPRGSSTTMTVTLTNTGTIAVPITSITVAGAAVFSSPTNTCGASVPVMSSCTIDVRFQPKATGNKTGTLRVDAGAGAAPRTVPLSGAGT